MDSSVAENLVIYDWLSFTSKVHTPDQLIAALGLAHVPWTETKGARGYRDRKYFSCISIHYNGRPDMGVWVEMSGQGCRTFESLSKVGWEGIFSFIRDNGLKITRLDVAYHSQSDPGCCRISVIHCKFFLTFAPFFDFFQIRYCLFWPWVYHGVNIKQRGVLLCG